MLNPQRLKTGSSKPKLKLKSDMAKVNWELVNAQFQRDQQRTGITMAEWCEQNNYNYQTARRYLKCYSQLPAKNETFQAATPNEQTNCAKTAQNGVKTAQETNAQKTAQIDNAQSGKAGEQKGEKKSTLSHSHTESVEPPPAKYKGHEANGQFKKGEYEGNPHPSHKFPAGHQHSTKHKGYAKFFPNGKFDEAGEMRLRDEIILARAQIISVAETIQRITEDIALAAGNPEVRADLYRTLLETQNTLDRRIARVESLSRTFSSIQIDKVTVPYRVAETERSKVVARKGAVETRMMEREEGGDTTPIGDIISEIQAMGSGGLMSGPTGNDTDKAG